jgi:cellulose synthase/poly-beta-1,6-N-acetylglucosamine synthase-like glycosyltransferase
MSAGGGSRGRLVSVIVDTYNHDSFIGNAIASVLDQDIGRAAFEVIVVDDGSTDRTVSVVEGFGSDVRLIRKQNGGQATAFNAAIPLASSPIVSFLDGDDWWVPEKLRTVAETLEADHDVGAVGHGFVQHRGSASVRRVADREVTLRLRSPGDVVPFLRHKSFLGTSHLTVRRSVLERIGPVPDALVVEADEYLFTLLAAIVPVRVLAAPLTNYRLHGGNLFQFDRPDPVKRARKQHVLAALAAGLAPELRGLGLPEAVVDDVLLPLEVDAERTRLTLRGGRRRDTLRTERAGRTVAKMLGAPSHPAVRVASLALATALPPERFYRLRDRYARTRAHA